MELDLILPKGYDTDQGLPRVCCVGHPEDRMRYQDEVAEDLQRIRPCAVYFLSADEEELDFVLSQVQVAVFLITDRFLEDPDCKAAFALAKKQRVPILPLQKEAGVEERFNESFGSYQLLWKEDPDPTVIGYKTKLRNFLDAVLLDEKTAADLRKAFQSAYIFLSYRKKNRALAQELMKRIHDLPGRDNIIIWYDEFLRAGDQWDETIEEKLKGSAMMVLAVTPDVLEEGNFVLTNECPTARKKKPKPVPILPVLVADTSPDDLKKLKDEALADEGDHDEDIWVNNDWKMEKKLEKRLKKHFGEGKKDGYTDEKLYRMGMAYLNGCHVEVCRERGVAMLEKAAEGRHGYLEAIRALADMYATGNGVEMDLKASIRLREKVVEQLRNSPGRAEEYQYELVRLGQDCYSAGNFELAEKYLKKAVDLAATMPGTAPAMLRLKFGITGKLLAYILTQKPEPDFREAEKQLEKVEKLERGVMKETKSVDKLEEYRMAVQSLLGTLDQRVSLYLRWLETATDEEKKRELEEKYTQCSDQSAKLREKFPNVAGGMEHAKWLFVHGQSEEAVAQAETALCRARQAFIDNQDDPWYQMICRGGVVGAYVNVAVLLLEVSEIDRAKKYISEAEEWNEPLLKAGETRAVKYAESLGILRARADMALTRRPEGRVHHQEGSPLGL